ncbi:efflux RND transporter periplasmic adaptor subunit [Rubritalea tangerina]|uniref:Efflux RND transporter periplasmic adaptor subunit n=1 Tax=Rubritalea tangerina TaxID=430798 RepID=A0ABW4Z7Y0_9BACT
MTSKLSLMATAFCITSLHAADYEVKKELFEQSVRVQGIAAPQNAAEVVIAPEIWGDFIVEKVLPQGTKVEKGQQIVWIDTKKVDKYIQEQELERKIDGIRLQKAQQELAELKLKTQRDLLVAKRNYEREVENYKRYQEVDLPDQIASTKFDGEKSEWYLSYTREELRQLLKMYEADGLTEETEEIIVQRAQNSVKSGEFSNKQKQKQVKFQLETGIPRQEVDRALQHARAKSAWEFAQTSIPRALELKELEVTKLVNADKKKAEDFAKVKADRAAMEIKAPAAGYLYYGEFSGNAWKREIAQKTLVRGAKLMAKRPFMVVVPEGNASQVTASVDGFTASRIKAGDKGALKLSTQPWKSYTGEVVSVGAVPNIQGKWDVVLKADLDGAASLKVGENVHADFVSYRKEDAISVPTKAVKAHADGSYTVKLKMADDKQEEKKVTVGESNHEKVEVLSGLDAGQVIIFEAK